MLDTATKPDHALTLAQAFTHGNHGTYSSGQRRFVNQTISSPESFPCEVQPPKTVVNQGIYSTLSPA